MSGKAGWETPVPGRLSGTGTQVRGSKVHETEKTHDEKNMSIQIGKTQAAKNSQGDDSQLYRQDGIIWQGRKAKTRGIHRGGDE